MSNYVIHFFVILVQNIDLVYMQNKSIKLYQKHKKKKIEIKFKIKPDFWKKEVLENINF